MTPNYNILTAPDDTIVCRCSGVSKGEIVACIASGAYSLGEIREQTGACPPSTSCGTERAGSSCAHDIVLLLAHYAMGLLPDMPQYPLRYRHAPKTAHHLLSVTPAVSCSEAV